MERIQTELEDVIILQPVVYNDKRGAFYESWREKDYQDFGIKEKFVQDNISISKKNVLRGLHFQKQQGQMLSVISGKIFDVVVDTRVESNTYGNYVGIELSSDHPMQIYMPPGFAHGFCVLSKCAVIHYKCTQYYLSEHEDGILWSDPIINIEWPIKDPIVSEKDSQFKPLRNFSD